MEAMELSHAMNLDIDWILEFKEKLKSSDFKGIKVDIAKLYQNGQSHNPPPSLELIKGAWKLWVISKT